MGDETIGQRLRRLRLERGLSQRDLASPGVTNAYVSRIEKGDRTPSVTAIRKLASRLGVSPEYLETGVPLSAADRRRWELENAELELRLGRTLESSEQRFRAVLDDALAAGDFSAEARARAGLGLCAAHVGRHEDAIRELERIVDGSVITPATRPDIYATLARSYAIFGQNDRAIELFERCLAWLREREPENSVAYVRFATYLSYALTDVEDHDRARAVIEDAIRQGAEAADPYTRIRLYWSEARLAAVEGNLDHAQASLRRAVALLEAVDDSIHLGRAHRLWAETLLDEDRTEEAHEHLLLAAQLLGAEPDAKDEALVHVDLARLHVKVGAIEEALVETARAIELSEEDLEVRGRTEWVLATASIATGDRVAADAHFRRAAECFGERSAYRRRLVEAWAQLDAAVPRLS
jgi:transcriptional regulator with XRE-family HTH domain